MIITPLNHLEISHLSFERQHISLFENLNFHLSSGTGICIKGPNGAGKTTLLRILAGFIEPTLGQILWNQQSIFKTNDYTHQLHYVGHQYGIQKHLTVLENIHFYCSLNHQPIPQALCALLETFQLIHLQHTLAEKLSAGQLKRLALLRLQLREAPLWILDEPLTALDQTAQLMLCHQLREYLTRGGCLVIASHQEIDLPAMKIIDLTVSQP